MVWDAKQANPDKSNIELALDLNLSPPNYIRRDNDGKIPRGKNWKTQKNILSATFGRYLSKANAAIANTSYGRFPDYTKPASKAKKVAKVEG